MDSEDYVRVSFLSIAMLAMGFATGASYVARQIALIPVVTMFSEGHSAWMTTANASIKGAIIVYLVALIFVLFSDYLSQAFERAKPFLWPI